MDLAALYGPTNAQLVRALVAQLLVLQPRYWGDVAAAAAPLAGNLRELRASCGAMMGRALVGGGGAEVVGELGGGWRGWGGVGVGVGGWGLGVGQASTCLE